MNRIIFSAFFALYCFCLQAQQISVEFSIEWKKDLDFQIKELNDERIHPAFLNITYRNISDKPLYCLKVADGYKDLPQILPDFGSLGESPVPLRDDNYFKRRYFVGFKSSPDYFGSSWSISNDTADIEYKTMLKTWKRPVRDIFFESDNDNENLLPESNVVGDTTHLSDWILIDLDNIYNYIYNHYYKANKIEAYQNFPAEITESTILNDCRKKFVFLKPDEVFVDAYNLIGFQITGGTFTFQFDDTKSLDYVEIEPVREERNVNATVQYSTQKLPEKVGIYELFKGDFLTNKVTVQFSGIKPKK